VKEVACVERKTNAFKYFSGIRKKGTTLEAMVKTWDKIKVYFKQQVVKT
jgi:hypothetical protein